MSSRVIALGVAFCSDQGIAEADKSGQLPDFKGVSMPSQPTLVEPLRPAWPIWQQQTDAWFLDGFSPAKNPELWEAELMRAVGVHTKPNGTFATYTAAGFVRRALDDAGFDIQRVAGFGRKRHMSVGVKRG